MCVGVVFGAARSWVVRGVSVVMVGARDGVRVVVIVRVLLGVLSGGEYAGADRGWGHYRAREPGRRNCCLPGGEGLFVLIEFVVLEWRPCVGGLIALRLRRGNRLCGVQGCFCRLRGHLRGSLRGIG